MKHAGAAPSTSRMALAVAALGAMASWAPAARAATGGPDTFGYTWRDSAEPGVTYAWEDISTLGRDIAVAGDDTSSGLQALGISFPYYSGVYSQVAACSNGWLSLVDGTSTAYGNGALPAGPPSPVGTIAAFWDDLQVDAVTNRSRILLYNTADHATVTWENVPDLGNTAVPNNFQVQLWTDGRIVIQYRQILGDRTSCTVGIESPDETDGLTAWQDVAAGVPASSYRIEFIPPPPAPNNLDCSRAMPLACGAAVSGDTRLGAANQNAYRCSRLDWSGKEQIWQVTLATPTSGRLVLEPRSGAPSMVVVAACDPNACIGAPSNLVNLNNAIGTIDVVVDSAPGQEGAYDLRLDCYPIPSTLACATATPLRCGDRISGDTRLGAANQDRYLCSTAAWGGREQVYQMDFPTAASGRLLLTATSGSPTMIVVRACDPNSCVGTPGNVVDLTGLVGTYDVVVDSATGQEGAYDLRADCFPVPNRLDCANAGYVDCGTTVSGDLALGRPTRTATSARPWTSAAASRSGSSICQGRPTSASRSSSSPGTPTSSWSTRAIPTTAPTRTTGRSR